VGAAIRELQDDVPAHISQQFVVAHSETILGIVAAGIPPIDGSHGAGAHEATRAEKEKTRWPSSPRRAVKVEISAMEASRISVKSTFSGKRNQCSLERDNSLHLDYPVFTRRQSAHNCSASGMVGTRTGCANTKNTILIESINLLAVGLTPYDHEELTPP
jgi:hypothetical protein